MVSPLFPFSFASAMHCSTRSFAYLFLLQEPNTQKQLMCIFISIFGAKDSLCYEDNQHRIFSANKIERTLFKLFHDSRARIVLLETSSRSASSRSVILSFCKGTASIPISLAIFMSISFIYYYSFPATSNSYFWIYPDRIQGSKICKI